eukprot:364976-Chlamydomonas_euryale.AAC.16
MSECECLEALCNQVVGRWRLRAVVGRCAMLPSRMWVLSNEKQPPTVHPGARQPRRASKLEGGMCWFNRARSRPLVFARQSKQPKSLTQDVVTAPWHQVSRRRPDTSCCKLGPHTQVACWGPLQVIAR